MHYHTCSYIVLHVPLTHYINMHILITFVSASATYTHCAESHTGCAKAEVLTTQCQPKPCTSSPNINPVCITILVTCTTSPCSTLVLTYNYACIPAGKRSAITGTSMYVSSVQYISVMDCCIANCCYPVAVHKCKGLLYSYNCCYPVAVYN